MLNRIKQRKSEGFTIIEVMIVLAIAGLILLIVFLAVPALQRNSRNTQRKSDAAAVAGAVSNYFSNNGGVAPAGKATGANPNEVNVCATAACTGNLEVAKLGYYLPANASIFTSSATPGTPTKDTVIIDTGYECNSTNTGLGLTSSRSAVILYAVETSSTTIAQQCVEQ